jgi:hypothetical protein
VTVQPSWAQRSNYRAVGSQLLSVKPRSSAGILPIRKQLLGASGDDDPTMNVLVGLSSAGELILCPTAFAKLSNARQSTVLKTALPDLSESELETVHREILLAAQN